MVKFLTKMFSHLILSLLSSMVSVLVSAKTAKVESSRLVFYGLERTNELWLRQYLDLSIPIKSSPDDLKQIQTKILTTGVFSHVQPEVLAEGKLNGQVDNILKISVKEKWTTIPVVRTEFGGGTPFYVVGLYDQHSFGRLLTIGAQFQKYGDEEPGFVAWVRAPRLKGGKFNLGVEYWDDVRKRTFYDMKGKEQSSLVVRGKTIRGFYQSRHRNLFRSDKIKAGVDLKVRELYDSSVEVFTNPIGDELVHPKIGRSLKALAVLVYDDIDINNYDYDGLRLTSEVGKIFESKLNFNTYRLEGFYYQIVHPINFAAHFEWDVSESRSMADIRFVGGFGSVSGRAGSASIPPGWA